ncbi:hypothetical protein V2J09_000279 [Rumex salicifolius]
MSSSSLNKATAFAIRRRKEIKKADHSCHHQEEIKVKALKFCRYEEIPEYMKDNEYIVKYYRVEWPLKHALFSLFQWHNETLNAWTHLIGFLLFLALTIVNFVPVPDAVHLFGILRPFAEELNTNVSSRPTQLFVLTKAFLDLNETNVVTSAHFIGPFLPEGTAPRWPFYVFLAGSMFCLFSSAVCHLFSCHSHHVNTLLLRIDFVGITTMIITSFFPPVYYVFLCSPRWQLVYLSGITLFGLLTIAALLTPTLSSGKCRAPRALLFCSMALLGLIPAVHACVVNWGNPKRSITLVYEVAMALSYLTGTAFYVSRVPERFKPGWFDLAGHSHQIFHVFVVLGAVAHYGAALVFLQWRDEVGCSATS